MTNKTKKPILEEIVVRAEVKAAQRLGIIRKKEIKEIKKRLIAQHPTHDRENINILVNK